MQSLSNKSAAAPNILDVKVKETSRMEMHTWYVSKNSHHPYFGRNSWKMRERFEMALNQQQKPIDFTLYCPFQPFSMLAVFSAQMLK